MSDSQSDFESLMQRLRDGCPDAARELLEIYGPHVLRVVRRKLNQKLRSKFDSVDFVQDVWASFFVDGACPHTFERPEDLIAFLVDLARKKVIGEFRDRVQTQKRNLNREHSLDGSAAHQADLLTGRQPTPSQVLSAREQWELLLNGQPEHYQQILILFRQGKKQQEIAAELGLTVRTVRRVIRKVVPGLMA